MRHHHITATLATIALAALTSCGPSEPTIHPDTAGLEQQITAAGADDCTWEDEAHSGYTYSTCDSRIILVTADHDGTLDDWTDRAHEKLEHGYTVRTDHAVAITPHFTTAVKLTTALGADYNEW